MPPKGTLRICPNGHRYYKSSDCPTCPICEQDKALTGFPKMPAPARRALESAGIRSLKQLAKKSEAEILALHGMGPSTLPKLRAALKAAGLAFKKA
jgi:hypothetical protein